MKQSPLSTVTVTVFEKGDNQDESNLAIALPYLPGTMNLREECKQSKEGVDISSLDCEEFCLPRAGKGKEKEKEGDVLLRDIGKVVLLGDLEKRVGQAVLYDAQAVQVHHSPQHVSFTVEKRLTWFRIQPPVICGIKRLLKRRCIFSTTIFII